MFKVTWMKSKLSSKKKEINKNLLNFFTSLKYFSFTKNGTFLENGESQDSCLTIENKEESYLLFGIFDGNGINGSLASSDVADFIKSYFKKNNKEIKKFSNLETVINFFNQLPKTIEKKLRKSKINYENSGTTSLLIFLKYNFLVVSNIGNSKAVLCRIEEDEIKAIELNTPHDVNNKNEINRIKKHSGYISKTVLSNQKIGPRRFWVDSTGPGYTTTRSLGNFEYNKKIFCSENSSDYIYLKSSDKFIVMATDGIWDVMTTSAVISFINNKINENIDHDDIVLALIEHARFIWEQKSYNKSFHNEIGDVPDYLHAVDDITAIIIFLEIKKTDDNYNLVN